MKEGNRDIKYVNLAKGAVRVLDGAMNLAIFIILLGSIVFGIYAIWDSEQIYEEAKASRYEQYKPQNKETHSFEDLRKINPEVVGWLNVYGTNIDYPLVQGKDNEKYVNTSVMGEAELSGSLFLDYRNQTDFSDFNTIIYGHHMSKQVMFGEISSFEDREYFNKHRYGKLYDGKKYYGIEFFAFVEGDSYDYGFYKPGITEMSERKEYLANLLERSTCKREIPLNVNNRMVLLSTCTTGVTNGRHLLIGLITNVVREDPFAKDVGEGQFDTIKTFLKQPMLWVLIIILLGLIIFLFKRRKEVRSK